MRLAEAQNIMSIYRQQRDGRALTLPVALQEVSPFLLLRLWLLRLSLLPVLRRVLLHVLFLFLVIVIPHLTETGRAHPLRPFALARRRVRPRALHARLCTIRLCSGVIERSIDVVRFALRSPLVIVAPIGGDAQACTLGLLPLSQLLMSLGEEEKTVGSRVGSIGGGDVVLRRIAVRVGVMLLLTIRIGGGVGSIV